jgi:hypothetical protein
MGLAYGIWISRLRVRGLRFGPVGVYSEGKDD